MTVRLVPPRVPVCDPRTGLMTREWYLFFQGIMDPAASQAEQLAQDLLLAALAVPTAPGDYGNLALADELDSLPAPFPEIDDDLLMVPPPQAAAGTVTEVSGTAPIVSSGGETPAISITPATALVPGSMSAADKAALDKTQAAWSTYAPVILAGSGGGMTFSTPPTGFYRQIGKTVELQIIIPILANGTTGSFLFFSLPPAITPAREFAIYGAETGLVGFGLAGYSISATQGVVIKSDGTYPGGAGYRLVFHATYETT